MAKICLILAAMVGLAAAGVMDTRWMQDRHVDRDRDHLRTTGDHMGSIDIDHTRRMSTDDVSRQHFILKLLERVHVPLVDRDICRLGNDFETDVHRYRKGIDDDMMHVIDVHRGNSRRNDDFSLTDREHIRQMVGLYRLLVRSIDWDTFMRNVCCARMHMNGVLFVNALLPALRDRVDTHMLIVPGIHDILPEMFLDSHVLDRVRNIDLNMLNHGSNVDSTKSNLLDMIGMGRQKNVMDIIRNRDDNARVTGRNDVVSRSHLWMPWREMHMEMSLDRTHGRKDIVSSNVDDRIVIPGDEMVRDMRLVTQDVGLKGFLQYLVNDLCIRENELLRIGGRDHYDTMGIDNMRNRNMNMDDHLMRDTGIRGRTMHDVHNVDDHLMRVGVMRDRNMHDVHNMHDINRLHNNIDNGEVPYVGRGGNLYSKTDKHDDWIGRTRIHDGRRVTDDDDRIRHTMNIRRDDRWMDHDRNDDMHLNRNWDDRRHGDLLGDVRDLPTTTINDDRLLHKNHKKLISLLYNHHNNMDNTLSMNSRDRFMNVMHGNRMDNDRWNRDDTTRWGHDDLMHRRMLDRNDNIHLGRDDMIHRSIHDARHMLNDDSRWNRNDMSRLGHDDMMHRDRVDHFDTMHNRWDHDDKMHNRWDHDDDMHHRWDHDDTMQNRWDHDDNMHHRWDHEDSIRNRWDRDDMNRRDHDDIMRRHMNDHDDTIRNRWDRDDMIRHGIHKGDDDMMRRHIVDGRHTLDCDNDMDCMRNRDRLHRLDIDDRRNMDRDDIMGRRVHDDIRRDDCGNDITCLRMRGHLDEGIMRDDRLGNVHDRIKSNVNIRDLPTTSINDDRLLHVNRKRLLNLNSKNIGDSIHGGMHWNDHHNLDLNTDRTTHRLSIFDRDTDRVHLGDQMSVRTGDRDHMGHIRDMDDRVMGMRGINHMNNVDDMHRLHHDDLLDNERMIRNHRMGGISNGRGVVHDDDWRMDRNMRDRNIRDHDDNDMWNGIRTTSVNNGRLLHVNRRHMNWHVRDNIVNDDIDMHHRIPRDTRVHDMNVDTDLRINSEVLLHNLKQLLTRLHMERLSLGLTNDLLTDNTILGDHRMNMDNRRNDLGNMDHVTGDMNALVDNLLRNIVTDRRVDNQIDIDHQIADHLLGKQGNMNILHLIHQVLTHNNRNNGGILTLRDLGVILTDDGIHNMLRRLMNLIDLHRTNIMGRYTRDDLALDGVIINDINIDELRTFIDGKDIDLTNLVDTHKTHKMVVARMNRLNHRDFTIKLRVTSDRNRRVVVRTLLVPKLGDHMTHDLNIDGRRLDFMLLDTHVVNLNNGENLIVRRSRDILWTRNDVTPLTKIYEHLMTGHAIMNNIGRDVGQDCRFPHNLLLPRGRVNGLPMEIVTIITGLDNDRVRDDLKCGLGIGDTRIDGRSLGFPFDRHIENGHDLLSLRNIHVKDVLIHHDDNMRRDLH